MTARRNTSAGRLAALGLVVVAAVALGVGCSSDDDAASSKESTSTSTTTSVPTDAGPSTTGPPATAPVSAPVADVVEEPVGIDTPADLGGDVTVTLTAVDTLDVEAKLPGETAGPAVAATLEVRNGSKSAFDLSTVAVTASYGDGTPAIVNRSEPAADFAGTVEPGGTAKGVYVFRAPADEADSVVVEVQSGTQPNVVRFKVG